MKTDSPAPLGKIASLHLHPIVSGEALNAVKEIQVVEGKGILDEPRFFGKLARDGQPSKRQISLIEREQLDAHAATFSLGEIPPGTIRSNIETSGVELGTLIDRRVKIGDAVLHIYEARTGCEKMDRICNGLREASGGGKLGVLAQVVKSGNIRVGDEIFSA